MQEMRIVEPPYFGLKLIRKVVEPALSMISVAVQELDAPVLLASDCGVPEPMRVNPTPLLGTKLELHVQVPEGILIVSPLTTLCVGPLMTAFTSE
jgi:hypothetical protein